MKKSFGCLYGSLQWPEPYVRSVFVFVFVCVCVSFWEKERYYDDMRKKAKAKNGLCVDFQGHKRTSRMKIKERKRKGKKNKLGTKKN
jgi:hypothetical protein